VQTVSLPAVMSLTALADVVGAADEAEGVDEDELQPAIARPLAATRAIRAERRSGERTMGLLVCRGQAV
jgi:hypothetical protein